MGKYNHGLVFVQEGESFTRAAIIQNTKTLISRKRQEVGRLLHIPSNVPYIWPRENVKTANFKLKDGKDTAKKVPTDINKHIS